MYPFAPDGPPARWVSAETFPVGEAVWDRPELGLVLEVRPAGSVGGVPMVRLFGVGGFSPLLPSGSLVGVALRSAVVAPVLAEDESAACVEVAPAESFGAGPVLVFLAPWLTGVWGSLVLEPSSCSAFGFRLVGSVNDLRAVSRELAGRFGAGVLVGAVEALA